MQQALGGDPPARPPVNGPAAVPAPVCVYCWPILTAAVCEHNGHPCCGQPDCVAKDKPDLPAFLLKPRSASLFDECTDEGTPALMARVAKLEEQIASLVDALAHER